MTEREGLTYATLLVQPCDLKNSSDLDFMHK